MQVTYHNYINHKHEWLEFVRIRKTNNSIYKMQNMFNTVLQRQQTRVFSRQL